VFWIVVALSVVAAAREFTGILIVSGRWQRPPGGEISLGRRVLV